MIFLFFYIFYLFVNIQEKFILGACKNIRVFNEVNNNLTEKSKNIVHFVSSGSKKHVIFVNRKKVNLLKRKITKTFRYAFTLKKNNLFHINTLFNVNNLFNLENKEKNCFMIFNIICKKTKISFTKNKKYIHLNSLSYINSLCCKNNFVTYKLIKNKLKIKSGIMSNMDSRNNIDKRYNEENEDNNDTMNNINRNCNEEKVEKRNPIYMTSEEVRSSFINYFNKKNHTIVESSSVVPYNDNTLLFTNAGMNQFKKIFLGNVDKNSDLGKLKRAVDTQKCIRAGGKHNDLDDVGKDVYHHTFFEMLGNWSFGDYFKEESIEYAWDLLTNVYKINPDRLYVTYYGGDPNLPACPEDIETKKIWTKYLDEKRILPFGIKENFWEMAETGPCGPCSEIHYDRIGNRDASHLVNKDDPSVLEIWNIVFMQYNKDENKNMNKLPYPCIDTGMGLERITSILQNVNSNYDTDLFQPIFKQIKEIFNYLPDYGGKINEEDTNKIDTAYRVISDHIRCVTIAISDGCLPSNEGRNYVIRRIIRRAIRFGKQVFNIKSNVLWFYKLVDSVCYILGNSFKDLKNEKKVNYIKNIIKQEEILFNKTLEKGVDQFHKIIKKSSNNSFSGKDAFDLYTSYGFPIDLIEIMCEEKNFKLNIDEFNNLFKKHQLISDTNNFKITKFFDIPVEKSHELKNKYKISATVDHHKYNWNNNELKNDFKLKSYIQIIYDGTNFLDNISCTDEDKKYALILNETNFYYENGGQIYDIGYIQNDNMNFQVLNVQKINDYVLHIGILLKGNINRNDEVETIVDFQRRKLIACNHTATHLLNFAIRKVLSDYISMKNKQITLNEKLKGKEKEGNDFVEEKNIKSSNQENGTVNRETCNMNKDDDSCSIFSCEQKGSLVDEEKLRFDFSFFENINIELISKIEEEINNLIKEELNVYIRNMNLTESKKIKGIRAIFEEDYADKVNVVFIDKDVNKILDNLDVNYTYLCSIELCGGTHIANTKYIKKFVISSEESIGKGIYRITAVTNKKAEEVEKKFDDLYMKYKSIFEEPNENKLTYVQNYKRMLKEDKFLPYIKKHYILQDLEKIEKSIIEKAKNMQKELYNKAMTIGKVYSLEKKDGILVDIKFFDEIKGNQKVLEKIVQSYTKSNNDISYFFIISDYNNTYCTFEIKDSLKGKNIQADIFMKEIMKLIEGHSGGSKKKAFGSVVKDKGLDLKNFVEEAIKKYY